MQDQALDIVELRLALTSNDQLEQSRYWAWFWSHVDRPAVGCWEWQGNRDDRGGYGVVGRKGKAHRMAYTITFGDPGTLLVLHRCDNKACCNPRHLFLGSMRANLLDAYAKGRKQQPQGAARQQNPHHVEEIVGR